jgi:putative Holliday junction resolvase
VSTKKDPDLSQIVHQLEPGARLMGFDVGSKRLGVAISDGMLKIATPLETLKRSKFSADAQKLIKLMDNHFVGALVFGLPLNMNGTEGPRAQSTRAFARNLAAHTSVPMCFWDERLSTAAVTRTLLEADISRRRRREVVDKMAASFILQGALDYLSLN